MQFFYQGERIYVGAMQVPQQDIYRVEDLDIDWEDRFWVTTSRGTPTGKAGRTCVASVPSPLTSRRD